jgi:YebC/PmpR family DNA-binding regulatory protein
MSGHSKWSKVKHQKAVTDVVKAREFTKASRAITVSVSEGGGIGDPEKNFRLRLAVEKARSVNMPKENIQRAIDKALSGSGIAFEQVEYEGYGPGGVAIVVEAATDNRQRTSSNVKHTFDHAGGSLAVPGAVNFMFARLGVIVVERDQVHTFDELLEVAIANGAQDVIEQSDVFEVYTTVVQLRQIKEGIEQAGYTVENTEIIMKPTVSVDVTDDVRVTTEQLVEALEALDDVQKVFTSID